jgi:hypothetical protein
VCFAVGRQLGVRVPFVTVGKENTIDAAELNAALLDFLKN